VTPAIHRVVRGTSAPGGRIRVMAVDDSVVIRHLIREALQEDPDIEFVGAEGSGAAALERIRVLKPDLVTLDIEMPGMDGLEVLRQIRKLHPRLRTIMFSTLTQRGSAATFEALSLGADDYVAKAANGGSLDRSLTTLRAELIPKIKQFFTVRPASLRKPAPSAVVPSAHKRPASFRALAIGVSTGGPQALENLIPKLPANFPLPVLIVQHMPAMFTRLLAERLNAASPLTVEEAVDGREIVPGRVLVAPGDFHLRVRRAGLGLAASLDKGPYENSCRPSVDVLFRSLAESCRGHVLSVILTGMGSDGKKGTEALKAAGAYSIAQDEATSVVWGMPGSVVDAGLADRVLPLPQIVPEIVRLAAGRAV
jgi:two-component system chemotaxis response regulator CheB